MSEPFAAGSAAQPSSRSTSSNAGFRLSSGCCSSLVIKPTLPFSPCTVICSPAHGGFSKPGLGHQTQSNTATVRCTRCVGPWAAKVLEHRNEDAPGSALRPLPLTRPRAPLRQGSRPDLVPAGQTAALQMSLLRNCSWKTASLLEHPTFIVSSATFSLLDPAGLCAEQQSVAAPLAPRSPP